MKAEIIHVELSASRGSIRVVLQIDRPVFPKDYTNEKESTDYLNAVKQWQAIHTGYVEFNYLED